MCDMWVLTKYLLIKQLIGLELEIFVFQIQLLRLLEILGCSSSKFWILRHSEVYGLFYLCPCPMNLCAGTLIIYHSSDGKLGLVR